MHEDPSTNAWGAAAVPSQGKGCSPVTGHLTPGLAQQHLKLDAGFQGDYGLMSCPSQEIPTRQDSGTSAAHCAQA